MFYIKQIQVIFSVDSLNFSLHIFISNKSEQLLWRAVEAFYTDVIDIGQRLLEVPGHHTIIEKGDTVK